MTRPRRPPARRAAPEKPPGIQARFVAARAVDDVLRHRTPLTEALDRAFADPTAEGLDSRDRGLVHAIATVTFRRYGTISAALDARLSRGWPDNAGRLQAILATAAAQVLFLDLPAHAVVDLAVTLVSGDRFGSRYAPLANAVLRRIAGEADVIRAASDPLTTDTPDWLRARWIAAWGETTARAVAAAHQAEPPLDLTVRADPGLWAERLGAARLSTGTLRLTDPGLPTALPGFAEGAWWVQDAAAALPARLVRARPGMRVADLCAAPGGKTAQLAAAGAHVTAVDKSAGRLDRLAANLARLGLSADIKVADAATFDGGPFDAVLLDAPCSATGTLRRHPDVAFLKRETDVASLSALQTRLIDHAAGLVRPGGTLVYCTCSLEPEEGERIVEALLARRPDYTLDPVRADEIGGQTALIDGQGRLRVLPCHDPLTAGGGTQAGGQDGFFAARLIRG
jgi:16S rRNA (cytosine967-C5)-methyltransferase